MTKSIMDLLHLKGNKRNKGWKQLKLHGEEVIRLNFLCPVFHPHITLILTVNAHPAFTYSKSTIETPE